MPSPVARHRPGDDGPSGHKGGKPRPAERLQRPGNPWATRRRFGVNLPIDPFAMERLPATELTPATAEVLMQDLQQPAWRGRQLLEWVYQRKADDFDAMSNLPLAVRGRLCERIDPRPLQLARMQGSSDTTRKFLWRLHDGRYVETVLIPASPALYGGRSDRLTLCVSSQVGCAYACRFCASGLAGFTRNLSTGEIVGQVVGAARHSGQRIDNLVFMGMGEPLANLGRLLPALEILNASWGLGIGARHMTISTSGLAPQIERLAQVPLQIRLAISLHGASNEVRDRIMPVNRRYPIERLFEALQVWRRHKNQKLTFEYILIDQVNDGLDQAALLGRQARGLDAKVNLIPYNTVHGLPWERPPLARQEQFLSQLRKRGVSATLRREKGHDIDAACGQLRLQEETADGLITDTHCPQPAHNQPA